MAKTENLASEQEAPRFKLDLTLNIPTMIGIVTAILAVLAGYTNYREDKLKTEFKVEEHDRVLASFAKALEKQGSVTQELVGQVSRFSQAVDDLKDQLRHK